MSLKSLPNPLLLFKEGLSEANADGFQSREGSLCFSRGRCGIPVSLLSDALHYQSATKLACKLETNLLNNVFPTFPFPKLLVIHFAYNSPFPLVKCFGPKTTIHNYNYTA